MNGDAPSSSRRECSHSSPGAATASQPSLCGLFLVSCSKAVHSAPQWSHRSNCSLCTSMFEFAHEGASSASSYNTAILDLLSFLFDQVTDKLTDKETDGVK